MGFAFESWEAALQNGAMFIGADGGVGWYTAIALVMMIVIIVVGNSREQEKYNKQK